MATLSVVGSRLIENRISMRLLNAGRYLVGYNRTPAKAKTLIEVKSNISIRHAKLPKLPVSLSVSPVMRRLGRLLPASRTGDLSVEAACETAKSFCSKR